MHDSSCRNLFRLPALHDTALQARTRQACDLLAMHQPGPALQTVSPTSSGICTLPSLG